MKRYYTIDSVAMKTGGLNYTTWTICENIHFRQGVFESGYCEDTRADLADHHDLTVGSFKNLITKLVGLGYLKRNEKDQLKTAQKWHEIEGHNKMTVDENRGHNKMTTASQKNDARGHNKMTVQPIEKELDRVRENKNIKKDFTFSLKSLTQHQNLSAEYKSKLAEYAGDENMLNAMIDYHTANGKGFKDWAAAFRTWKRNDEKFGNKFGKKSKEPDYDLKQFGIGVG